MILDEPTTSTDCKARARKKPGVSDLPNAGLSGCRRCDGDDDASIDSTIYHDSRR
jgi:hypothetical protein